jgi:serine/threonine-protein kinase
VASVFHLGTKNGDYFYAMEFVEGEALDHVIKSRGPMPPALAIDIVDQVAAALEQLTRNKSSIATSNPRI